MRLVHLDNFNLHWIKNGVLYSLFPQPGFIRYGGSLSLEFSREIWKNMDHLAIKAQLTSQ